MQGQETEETSWEALVQADEEAASLMEELEEMGACAGSPLDGCDPPDSSSAVEASAAQVRLRCHSPAERQSRGGSQQPGPKESSVEAAKTHCVGVHCRTANNALVVATRP